MIHKSPTESTVSAHRELAATLPFADMADLADADRGFLGSLKPGMVHAADGRVVWDNDSYAFLTGDAPASVNPSLWRQSGLVAKQGLFEVVEGIYQVRGPDLSNMTIVEGDTGVIVIDPLISTETAAAALALYREHRGDRPVVAVIYTHSRVDHFGGVFGSRRRTTSRIRECGGVVTCGRTAHHGDRGPITDRPGAATHEQDPGRGGTPPPRS